MAGEFLYALCKSWLSSRIHTFSYDAKGDITIVHKVPWLLGDILWIKIYVVPNKKESISKNSRKKHSQSGLKH